MNVWYRIWLHEHGLNNMFQISGCIIALISFFTILHNIVVTDGEANSKVIVAGLFGTLLGLYVLQSSGIDWTPIHLSKVFKELEPLDEIIDSLYLEKMYSGCLHREITRLEDFLEEDSSTEHIEFLEDIKRLENIKIRLSSIGKIRDILTGLDSFHIQTTKKELLNKKKTLLQITHLFNNEEIKSRLAMFNEVYNRDLEISDISCINLENFIKPFDNLLIKLEQVSMHPDSPFKDSTVMEESINDLMENIIQLEVNKHA